MLTVTEKEMAVAQERYEDLRCEAQRRQSVQSARMADAECPEAEEGVLARLAAWGDQLTARRGRPARSPAGGCA